MEIQTVGARVRRMRQALGLSQGDVEKSTGLMRCYLSRLENGHQTPSLGTLEKICAALGITLYEFFGGQSAATDENGLSLPAADVVFLQQVQRSTVGMNERQKDWLLQMVKMFSGRLLAGKIPPKPEVAL